MTQDTRKDPRAKVLTMTVRYKSATVDEFIEQYSLDISRGGIFIKTSSPFAPGTLLKFEIRIAEDRTVLQGIGRVVWKREPAEADAGGGKPAGMGVKFIKIDDASKQVIEDLVTQNAQSGEAYEVGLREEKVAAKAGPEESAPAGEGAARKATMIGLGGLDANAVIAAAMAEAEKSGSAKAEGERADAEEPSEEKPAASFFPETDSEADMPPPEERTVMRQAAELLEEALLGAGGTMDEIGSIGAEPLVDETGQGSGLDLSKSPTPSAYPPPRSTPPTQSFAEIPDDVPSMHGLPDLDDDEVAEEAAALAATDDAPDSVDTESEGAAAAVEPEKDEVSTPRPAPAAPVPPVVPVSTRGESAETKSGGGRAFVYLGLVAAAAVGVYFLMGDSSESSAPKEAQVPAMTEPAEPAKQEESAEAPPAEGEPAAESEGPATEEGEEEAEKAAAPEESDPKDEKPEEVAPTQPAAAPAPKPAPKPAPPAPQAAPKPAPKPAPPAPEAAPKPAPKPKPAAESPPAPAPKPAAKPAAPPAEKAEPAPKPKPKPAPPPPADDNPY